MKHIWKTVRVRRLYCPYRRKGWKPHKGVRPKVCPHCFRDLRRKKR